MGQEPGPTKSRWRAVLLGAAIGAMVGWLVGAMGQGRGMACPFLCNPPLTAGLFAVAGGLIGLSIGSRAPSRIALDNLLDIEAVELFKQVVLGAPKPALAQFYAHWCPGCKRTAREVDSVAAEYAGRVVFVKVDIDKAGDLAREQRIEGVPTVLLFARGKEVRRIVGATWSSELKRELDALLQGQ